MRGRERKKERSESACERVKQEKRVCVREIKKERVLERERHTKSVCEKDIAR